MESGVFQVIFISDQTGTLYYVNQWSVKAAKTKNIISDMDTRTGAALLILNIRKFMPCIIYLIGINKTNIMDLALGPAAPHSDILDNNLLVLTKPESNKVRANS